ncbi:hypothetical protein [Streptomyces sp. CB01373]|uniref:hypothetical protein n=1 Tax=Streptomyces sp. CB01373 TaxID=2020325 RepID=UPI00131BFF7D|nr:hypothetical protein [Streptomyces sp. CB01373]
MSVSRTALRLIATCVASGALVGAAALPALAAGADHDGARNLPQSQRADLFRIDHDHDRDDRHGHFGDRDRDRDRDRAWHHGWYNNRPWYRHHGWYGDRHHFPGRR